MASDANVAAQSHSGLADRYANALLALADDKRQTEPDAVDRIAADLQQVLNLWHNDGTFRAFVADPRLAAVDQQKGVFALLARAGIGKEVHNLLGVLITNRRLAALPQVATAFAGLLAARRGQQSAQVTTAHPLNDTQRAQIAARLTEAGFANVKLAETVDPTVLGGLILRIGSRLYDSSIKSKLQRLQYAMKGAA